MFGIKLKNKIDKISFNMPREETEKLDELCDIFFNNRTEVIRAALKWYYKKVIRDKNREYKNKKEG